MPEVLLGVWNKKEYYLNENNAIVWPVPDIREAVRAPAGRKIFSADFSQIEVKIMAFLSQDPFLKGAINSGKDMHCYMAAEIFDHPYDLVYKAYKDKKHPQHDEFTTLRANVKTVTLN